MSRSCGSTGRIDETRAAVRGRPELNGRGPCVDDNVFAGNTAWEGAGVRFCFFFGVIAEPTVTGNTFIDNAALGAGGGIGIYSADPVVANCTLDGNSAGDVGGGIYAAQCEEPPVVTNTIVSNSTSGGGIAVVDAALATALCDVWGNVGGDYINCGPGPSDMSADALYCDQVERDLTLRDDSPCLPENNPWNAHIGAHGAGGCGTSAGEAQQTASAFRLAAPIPNPAAGPVELRYELSEPGADVELTILTVDGRVVRKLHAAPGDAGSHSLVWDGRDGGGRPVASGVYLIRGRAAGSSSYRGLVILRGN